MRYFRAHDDGVRREVERARWPRAGDAEQGRMGLGIAIYRHGRVKGSACTPRRRRRRAAPGLHEVGC